MPPTAGCVSTATVVCTQYGQLQGAIEGHYRLFRGIPFAAPPVGDLRWRPPAAPASWQGVRPATAFGNRCPQVDRGGAPVGDEDCLTLNVYAVNPPASSKQPVIVIIHGGGNRAGSAQDPPWNDVSPLAGHGAIVVTVQYRLGLLGWLVNPLLTAESPQATSGNYTLLDLVAALQWVRDNIAGFGGDPKRVLIVGHSAGSLNVQALLASPAADGLFSAAVMESGLLRGGLIGTNIDVAYRWYADVPSAVGCDTATDVLACLRAVPASTLAQSGPQRAPVWRYLFTHTYENAAPQDAPLAAARAFHGAETYFVTGNFQSLGTSVTYSPSSTELALSDAMMDYWVALATSGDPNGSGATPWLPYDIATENILQLDDSIVTLAGGYRNAQCDFMTSLITRGF